MQKEFYCPTLILFFSLIILISLIIYKNLQSYYTTIEKHVKVCSDKKCFMNSKDGDLIFLSGKINIKDSGAFDKDFQINFKSPIMKREINVMAWLQLGGLPDNFLNPINQNEEKE